MTVPTNTYYPQPPPPNGAPAPTAATSFSASHNPMNTAHNPQSAADDSTVAWQQHEALSKIQDTLASDTANFSVTLINVYACVLGLSLLVIELKEIDQAIEYFLFLFTVKGADCFTLGCLIIDTQLFPLFTGMWLLAIGMAMFLVSFTRRVPYLTNFKDNWRVWNDSRTIGCEGLTGTKLA
ncbi:hypothetical protein BCR44DRAFT_1497943 [Catenaria anguillulae PL171]|uniref:Uncharacterized protein n=1 Tax=Catenaria anguillulae PL171 TaxID=765915 RepID=A0A1Y2HUV4_9FUNG|nr:hypothetical protein BCR44DRAFT_1497943 [Catenaria anguillulae PL171]